jgi:curved DNA-binding protein CbpA
MRRLTEENYYSLLGISPKASFEEVQSAYDEARATFAHNSLATYSLLSQDERDQILARLIDAYKTLTNTHLRREYNEFLIEKGELSSDEIGVSSSTTAELPENQLREVPPESLIQEKASSSEEQASQHNLDLFGAPAYVTGASIKMIRMEREMDLQGVYRKTNIPKQTLEDIEEENFERLPALVYLKGFLKAYADTLGVDRTQMMDGYLKRFLEWKTTGQK